MTPEMKELIGGDPIYSREVNEECKLLTLEERLDKIQILMEKRNSYLLR